MITPHSDGPAVPRGDDLAAALSTQALKGSLDAVVLLDGQGRVRYWNQVCERVFGFAATETLGAPIHELIIPERDREAHLAGVRSALQRGQSPLKEQRIEAEALHKDGHEIPVELTIAKLTYGGSQWFSCTMRDLSERRQAEESLRQSQERFRNLVETVPGMVYEFAMYADGSMAFEHVSAGCRGIYGFEAAFFLTKDLQIAQLIVDEDRPGFVESILVSAQQLTPWAWEGRTRISTGEVRWIRGQSRPMRRRDGATVWYGVVYDVTEAHGAQSALEATNAELEERVRSRTAELRSTQSEILERLGRAAAFRDDDTGHHIERMSRTCGWIAVELGLPSDQCALIVQAAPMHDIGKIAIPDSILHKPGRLTDEETAIMRTHAEIGARMLAGGDSELVQVAESIALTHHERWDGTGYPNKLQREEIPLVGRIAAVADVFDALTSERPYKRAWSVEAAIAEIKTSAGTHFDPAVVAAFVRALPKIAPESLPTGSRESALKAA